jgi:serine-threonine kinase receptor-associated protein|mmetsp:Transcript_78761/g.132164  ORF Transcript_78761/g.132164 Transcript_78761/m.132164 type:complete len:317 (+) Transcript_78761:25-975(+)|eukprot:CAMPEP_0174290700 /NCGR_PEP_ID=MMETSP0809-20121228/29823_1 /TAXON_ID=73025 ORGANISM="Eutreptiella gymnastica-like, Strain CCMP1594" /NCGR_SAMPLE_ID=MMETSP0809 /ASSEMBLY_ACC=CAM_ASM_000658 /LENGTH=316 /DNA_ID=CAMNT_0015389565 /DNA_START=27 /DNA_END=977 /DNA_ORIENTATION=+
MAKTGEEELAKVKVCSGHSRPVVHIAYSPVVEGSYWFVSSCLDGKPHLRNGQTGDWVGTFEGHKGAIWMSCFNNDATRLTTASGDYSAKLWNALDGSDLYTWTHPHCVKSADWYEAGGVSRILTGCMDKKIRLYDVNAPASDPFLLEGHGAALKTALFEKGSPDAVFSASSDNTVKRWDLRSQTCTSTYEAPDLNNLEYSKATNLLVVATKNAVTLLNPIDLSMVRQYPFLEEVECAAIAPNGQLFALGSKLKVKEYDKNSGNELQVHRGHHGPVFTVRYAPDSMAYASGSEDGMVRIWPNAHVIKQAKDAAGTGA